ncbi:MAG: hypothetical protein ABL921_34860, partial [Pirellula sp.]
VYKRQPVITTTGTPWSRMESLECGWWVPPTIEGIASALSAATQLEILQLREMGKRGASWVDQELPTDVVTQKYQQFYEWAISGGNLPTFVCDVK